MQKYDTHDHTPQQPGLILVAIGVIAHDHTPGHHKLPLNSYFHTASYNDSEESVAN